MLLRQFAPSLLFVAALMQAFKHISVLDLSQGIAGPVCAGILARQGANVIKVEPPHGDWIRATGNSSEGMSANAIAGNFNKRGIVLDAGKPAGRAALLTLAARADVLVENFRHGVMHKLGLDYATLRALNPRLVMCSITGFGSEGPMKHKAATDSVVQAFSGMAVANGTRNTGGTGGTGGSSGTSGSSGSSSGTSGADIAQSAEAILPRRIGLYVPDNISAIYAAQAISAALFERSSSGQGQHVQISLAGCCAAFQSAPMIDAWLFPPTQAKVAVFAPAGEFRTADGWIVVAAMSAAMFARLARAVGREDWLSDARYADSDVRKKYLHEINAELAAVLAPGTTAAWLTALEAADVLVSRVNDYAALRSDAQMQAMGYFATVAQPPYGNVTVPHLPAAARNITAAPRAGEHTCAVLREAGLSEAEIDALLAQGIAMQRES